MRRLVVIKIVLFICLMALLPLIKVEAKSSIYGELLGSGFLYSLNYEYFIKDDLPIRIGVERIAWSTNGEVNSIFGGTISESVGLGFPIITLSKLIGKGHHKLELGGGLTYLKFVEEGSKVYPDHSVIPVLDIERDLLLSGVVGYRYQLPYWEKGFLFRFSYTPLIPIYSAGYADELFIPIWFGLSLGYTF